MAPRLAGISHVTLAVPDLEQSVTFFAEVLGFEELPGSPVHRLMVERDLRLAMLLVNLGGGVTGAFDENQPGLDHLAFAVDDATELQEWDQRLRAHDVPSSGIVETDRGLHLNFRAPGGLPLELYVISASAAAELGIDQIGAAARTRD